MLALFDLKQTYHNLKGKIEGPAELVKYLLPDNFVSMLEKEIEEKKNIIKLEDEEYKICDIYINVSENNGKYNLEMKIQGFKEKNNIIELYSGNFEKTKEKKLDDIFVEMYETVKEENEEK